MLYHVLRDLSSKIVSMVITFGHYLYFLGIAYFSTI